MFPRLQPILAVSKETEPLSNHLTIDGVRSTTSHELLQIGGGASYQLNQTA
jgi:hypothetical protein